MNTPRRCDLAEEMAAHVRALVDDAPKLAPAQADRLAALLRPLEVPARPRRNDVA